MKRISKVSEPKPFIAILSVAIVMIATAIFISANNKQNAPAAIEVIAPKTYSSLEEIPKCNEKIESIRIEDWRIYEDKYNKFKVSIPSSFELFKGPRNYMSDEQYQKETYRPKDNSFSFLLESRYGSDSDLSFRLELNKDKCDSLQNCIQQSIEDTIPTYKLSCKTAINVNDDDITFIRTNFEDKTVGKTTYWIGYIQTQRGILKVSFSEGGRINLPFNSIYTSILNSLSLY